MVRGCAGEEVDPVSVLGAVQQAKEHVLYWAANSLGPENSIQKAEDARRHLANLSNIGFGAEVSDLILQDRRDFRSTNIHQSSFGLSDHPSGASG